MNVQRLVTPLLLVMFVLLGLFSASAQDVRFESRAIVVNPDPSFNVTVWLDKEGETPQYRVGEEIRINVRVDEDAFVYLYDFQPDGTITQILPNRFSDNNRLSAGETRTFPPRGAGYTFEVDPPEGLSKVVAVASKRRLDTEQLARFREGSNFAQSEQGEEGFQRSFRIVVRPVPQEQWVTATAYYETTSGRSRGRSEAQLQVRSQPSGAEVYLDGQRQGTTPLRLDARPGRRDLEIRRSGYDSYHETLQLRPGESHRIEASLQRSRRTGFVRFESSPSGAEVRIDGRRIGTTPIGERELDAGQYQVTFSRSGYQDEQITLQVRAGEERTVRAQLTETQGRLRVRGNVGGAQVFLDGRSEGTLSSGSGELLIDSLDPGTYQVTVVAPGFDSVVEDVRIRAGETRDLRVRQERR